MFKGEEISWKLLFELRDGRCMLGGENEDEGIDSRDNCGDITGRI